jgi:hypothetical protein
LNFLKWESSSNFDFSVVFLSGLVDNGSQGWGRSREKSGSFSSSVLKSNKKLKI